MTLSIGFETNKKKNMIVHFNFKKH